MEEQILKIISNNYDPDWEELGLNKSAKEITEHVMEFIEFTSNPYEYGKQRHEIELTFHNEEARWFIKEKRVTLEEVYQYWLNLSK